jgi:hypothetical protein
MMNQAQTLRTFILRQWDAATIAGSKAATEEEALAAENRIHVETLSAIRAMLDRDIDGEALQ